ncbi:CUN077 hypothetical protein [Culex nigripalpus nucleopolyhedrovirus]|uniref:Uncharacterized protein n=1 Tax=Culex nigripalpus nucleopolyhedrovirus (isolate Florida/1997) TaxID=645993 RepID=Q919J9_NPVCO|nr:CUN077 hypothetical protein [Culex nigripalpus nucleopolyhedrovirus]AAK94155.1 CUN077 hypothetical protein [Culex nigripalpus nucleopolyhedrovirus]
MDNNCIQFQLKVGNRATAIQIARKTIELLRETANNESYTLEERASALASIEQIYASNPSLNLRQIDVNNN